ncbi:hypothetical protein [Vibrio sp. D431a]|uniref:hypothetical protein n=1 Tax=Vibrio sp. D431a TaxID=2837388 RepID=UPI002553F020|nr:hypothetical protein [Vibrio sp. D431a]MDK9793733.1 hypothetical protein [Vibrio sp. D431a]
MSTVIETHIKQAAQEISKYVTKTLQGVFSNDCVVDVFLYDLDIENNKISFSFSVVENGIKRESAVATKGFAFFDAIADGQQSAIKALCSIPTKASS